MLPRQFCFFSLHNISVQSEPLSDVPIMFKLAVLRLGDGYVQLSCCYTQCVEDIHIHKRKNLRKISSHVKKKLGTYGKIQACHSLEDYTTTKG